MFRFQAQQVLSYLVVDEILRNVTPALGRTEVVDDEKGGDQDANSQSGISLVDEEHGGSRHETATQSRLPAEELESRPEVGSGADFEEKASQIHDEECHLFC